MTPVSRESLNFNHSDCSRIAWMFLIKEKGGLYSLRGETFTNDHLYANEPIACPVYNEAGDFSHWDMGHTAVLAYSDLESCQLLASTLGPDVGLYTVLGTGVYGTCGDTVCFREVHVIGRM